MLSMFRFLLIDVGFYFLRVGSTNTGMNSYRRVMVPNDITPKFLQAAKRNTGIIE